MTRRTMLFGLALGGMAALPLACGKKKTVPPGAEPPPPQPGKEAPGGPGESGEGPPPAPGAEAEGGNAPKAEENAPK